MPQSFKAQVRQMGTPCVEVPDRVSRALQQHAKAGWVAVHGTVNGVPFQATLAPVAGGRHRLYVNGGMRAAAGVQVGDTVKVVLRATRGRVVVPQDLAAGLRELPGAQAAFEALTPSNRRELVRYINDARTPEAREKRIHATAAHVLGRPAPPASGGLKNKPLWTCPKCGNRFVNKNSYHSCKRHRLEDVLASKPAHIQELFARYRRMVEACGPVTLLPYRDRIGFMVRVRFAGATPRNTWMDVGFWLPRRINHPRFRKIETLYPNAHIHIVRVTRPEDLNAQLAAWIKEAYAVGCQEHLG